MRQHRFYFNDTCKKELHMFDASFIHQILHVFRAQKGEEIILFGDSYEHVYTITSLSKKEIVLTHLSQTPSLLQEKKVTVLLAYSKKDSFELTLQKITELGVTDIVPLVTERSERASYNKDRLEKILQEATEQSGWGGKPYLHEAISLEGAVGKYDKNTVLLHTRGIQKSLSALSTVQTIFIGPEGGFTEKEVDMAQGAGIEILHIGKGVLRAETAAIVFVGGLILL